MKWLKIMDMSVWWENGLARLKIQLALNCDNIMNTISVVGMQQNVWNEIFFYLK